MGLWGRMYMTLAETSLCPSLRCEMFNKAYNHISDRIDQVYKDLTKGKAAPMGGVAYLSLEDNEVCTWRVDPSMTLS